MTSIFASLGMEEYMSAAFCGAAGRRPKDRRNFCNMTFKETEKQYRKAMEQLKSRIAGD
jgi:hypothetical protein